MRTIVIRLFLMAALLPLYGSAIARTFTVTNTLDEEEGSFRWAVEQCDWYELTPDTILFAIPTTDPGYDPQLGVWTIRQGTSGDQGVYRFMYDGAYVDGFSQARFIGGDPNPLGPEIQLKGPSEDGYNTLALVSYL